MDNDKCEFLDKCSFFHEYGGNSSIVKEAWIVSFCDSFENSANCKRKEYFREHGVSPAPNMSPTGRLL